MAIITISREMLLYAAQDYGISLDKLSEALSKPPGVLHDSDRERMKYLAYIRIELLKAVKDENVVYHGLASDLLFSYDPNLLRIGLVARKTPGVKDIDSRIRVGTITQAIGQF